MKLERIHTQVKEELKPVLKKLGIDNEEILKDIRDVSQTAEKEDVRLRALFKLSDILDLEDKNQTKITQVSGALFQGFKPEQLEEAQRPELPEGDK
jgi:SOS response regulatory protein OraA/RecX